MKTLYTASVALLLAFSPAALSADVSSRVSFGQGYSILLPAGWTAEKKGAHLQGEGPGGSFSVMSGPIEESLEKFVGGMLSGWQKKPGYELSGIDSITTIYGYKGKTALYRYSATNSEGTNFTITATVAIIQPAPNQVVTLSFAIPRKSADENPMEKHQGAFKGIWSSLQSKDSSAKESQPSISKKDTEVSQPLAPSGAGRLGVADAASGKAADPSSRVTFGGDGKYSVQLPAGWTVEKRGERLKGVGPGGMEFDGWCVQTQGSIDELTAKVIGVTEKKPGYKLAYNNPISIAGYKGQFVRYRYDALKGSLSVVKVFIQPAANQVVGFSFAVATGPEVEDPMETHKNTIQAMCSSLKISESTSIEVEASASKKDTDRVAANAGSRVAFGNNCSLQLPVGWTAKQDGKVLKGQGPSGASLDAMSVRTMKSIKEFMAGHLGNYEKKPGYKMVDVDPITTGAGHKGQIAYYQYSGTSETIAEVTVYIQAGASQIVVLIFGLPNGSIKPYQDAINAIYPSLEISE